jgi:hypothetical protein
MSEWLFLRRGDIVLQAGFLVETTSGTRFEDVDLSEKEWCDYDDKLGDSVGIYDLEYKLEAVKL